MKRGLVLPFTFARAVFPFVALGAGATVRVWTFANRDASGSIPPTDGKMPFNISSTNQDVT